MCCLFLQYSWCFLRSYFLCYVVFAVCFPYFPLICNDSYYRLTLDACCMCGRWVPDVQYARPYPTRYFSSLFPIQPRLTSYPTLPYPTLPYPTLPYPTLSYPTLSYPTLSYPILPYPTLPYPTLPCPIMLSLVIQYLRDAAMATLGMDPYVTLPWFTLTLPYSTPPFPTVPYPTLVCRCTQYYRDAARATLSMEAPRSIASKSSGSSNVGPKSAVEMGEMVTGKDTPEKFAQEDVMKQKVTELLMTLSLREQEVRGWGREWVVVGSEK